MRRCSRGTVDERSNGSGRSSRSRASTGSCRDGGTSRCSLALAAEETPPTCGCRVSRRCSRSSISPTRPASRCVPIARGCASGSATPPRGPRRPPALARSSRPTACAPPRGGALLGKPDVLVLDEPTNGLDPQGMRDIRRLLRRLADDGTTVFVSSHLLVEVEAMCDRVGVLAHGKLLAEGPPGTLRGLTDHARIEVDDVARALAVIASIDGVEPLQDGSRSGAGVVRVRLAGATTAAVNASLVSAGIAVSALTPERSSLEDVFIALVEGDHVPR